MLVSCKEGSIQDYLGPPPYQSVLMGVSISPRDQPSVPTGSSRQFAVRGRWSDGSSTVPAVTWSATGGSIDATGLFTAAHIPGTYQIIARVVGGTQADTALVSVVLELTGFRITPKVDTMVTGQTRQFSATLNWSDGQSHPVTISWSTTGGVINTTGVYSGTLVGSFLVIAACSCGAADTASVTVRDPISSASPTLMSLTLAPHVVALALGGVQQFSATGNWSDGTSGPVAVVYTATGGNISSAGSYVAGNVPGSYRVIATQQGGTRADTALVAITTPQPVLTQVVLNPSSVALDAGATQQFDVTGLWSDGSSTVPGVSYSATGGTISSSGLYTAGPTPGTYSVIVTQPGGGLADTSAVTIHGPDGPSLTQLVMNPSSVSVFPGSTQQFAVSASWSDGSSTLPPLSFTATGGTITASGLYSAGSTPGTYQVIVRHQGGTKADTSSITIPTLTGLTIAPKPATVAAGGTQLFSVTGTWSNGASTPPAVTYSATGGTISPAGLYIAGAPTGTFRVIARHTFGTRADTAVVTISGLAPPPPPSAGDLVVFPSPEVEFIIGPQLRIGSAANPWPWFDQNEVTRGLEIAAAFSETNPDPYAQNYYDLVLCLYTAYYRTGDARFLTAARRAADSWWTVSPQIASGTNTNLTDFGLSPREIALGGLMLRALDGRPEMWPWITRYVGAKYWDWIEAKLNDPVLDGGVRDPGYMLLYAAWLAKVHPDPAVRAENRAKALSAATNYFARLQYPDGSWRWLDPPPSGPISVPFHTGILLEGMIATHRLTGDNTVLQSILRGVTALYRDSWRTDNVGLENAPYAPIRWRSFMYVTFGDPTNGFSCVLPVTVNIPYNCGTSITTSNGWDTIRDNRQINATIVHAFGYAYYVSGDLQYRQWGDDVFSASFGRGQGPGADAMYDLADYQNKQYDQNYRAAGHYLVWRLGR